MTSIWLIVETRVGTMIHRYLLLTYAVKLFSDRLKDEQDGRQKYERQDQQEEEQMGMAIGAAATATAAAIAMLVINLT